MDTIIGFSSGLEIVKKGAEDSILLTLLKKLPSSVRECLFQSTPARNPTTKTSNGSKEEIKLLSIQ
jgi:hypothetical protein